MYALQNHIHINFKVLKQMCISIIFIVNTIFESRIPDTYLSNLNIFQVTFLLEIIYHDLSIININSLSINAIIFTNQWMQQVDENLRFDNLTHARV